MGRMPADALLFDLGGVVMGIDWDRAFLRWAQSCGEDAQDLGMRFTFDEPWPAEGTGFRLRYEPFPRQLGVLG